MNAFEYILLKQLQWAYNNKIILIGSRGVRGRPVYTKKLEENLFEPLESAVMENFKNGDGGELVGNPPKMSALHSSSALGINIFQYWVKIKQISKIAAACGFCSKNADRSQDIRFEQKYPISDKFRRSPNIDVIIENSSSSKFRVFAVECKFSEAYSSRRHPGLDPKYFRLDEIWQDVPYLYNFAKSISPKDDKFIHLHPAQLVKHILGLKKKYGKNKFRLLYLWYDCLGREGAKHKDEIEEFINITKKENIMFHALSYQELIVILSNQYRSSHENYIRYISGRYL